MIFRTGFLQPTRWQLAEARKWADKSFCSMSSKNFVQAGFPSFDGHVNAEFGATLLKLKNVEPHDDPWVGSSEDEPRQRRAIFWLLLSGGSKFSPSIWFGCGNKLHRMAPGDFVVFDDSNTHWVMSDRIWIGAAMQLQLE